MEREEKRQFDPDGLGAYVLGLPCVIEGCGRPVMRCHFKARRNGGAWREVFAEDGVTKLRVGNIYPGCDEHHKEEHRGIRTFQAKYGIDLDEITRRVGDDFKAGGVASGGLPW